MSARARWRLLGRQGLAGKRQSRPGPQALEKCSESSTISFHSSLLNSTSCMLCLSTPQFYQQLGWTAGAWVPSCLRCSRHDSSSTVAAGANDIPTDVFHWGPVGTRGWQQEKKKKDVKGWVEGVLHRHGGHPITINFITRTS